VAALASWLDARRAGGRWLLRMEDLDPPRVIPGAADAILLQLEACALQWDGPVVYQSARLGLYQAAVEKLQAHCYPCACTRKELEDSALAIDGSRIYPGTCRAGIAPGKMPREGRTALAVRVRTDNNPIRFTDRVRGAIEQCVEREVGDFVLRRADGVFAYQLAVVVDDAAQGVTDVVRGADLLDSTARQIHLQRLLGLATPRYLHLPAATNTAGEKLSKQTHATEARPEDLPQGLRFLGMDLPEEVSRISPGEMLDWASKHWDAGRIPKYRTIVLER
jgi:glutamyl-Q tRNA(Asp) synthetase